MVARCALPHGRQAATSKPVTLEQAKVLLTAAEDSRLRAASG